MKTKAEILLKRMSLLYENIYALLSAYQEAANNKSNVVSVQLRNEDGSLNSRDFNPIYFMGDDKERIYRYFNNDTKKLGENMGCSAEDDSICG